MSISANIKSAFEALKRKDFTAARNLMAGEDVATFESPHFLIKGLSELALNDWKAAHSTFTAATTRFPEDPLFWLNRGIAEENLDLIDAAIVSAETCLKFNPQQAEAHGNLANLYRKQKRFVLSERMARRALELGAARGDALNSLGLALGKMGRHAEADAVFAEAMNETPVNPFVISNRANLAVDRLQFDQAWPLFAQARAAIDMPVFRRDEGMARLLAGDEARGWELYESRLQVPKALRLLPDCPLWRGESLHGKKLLIVAEQGFGDVIQFCRYQEFLGEAELVWAVPKNMVRLLAANLRGAVLSEHDPLPVYDFYVPMMSLAWVTRKMEKEDALTTPIARASENFKRPHPPQAQGGLGPLPLPRERGRGHAPQTYLTAPATPRLPQEKHTKKIGVVWAGSRTHERDHERSIALSMLEPALRDVDADFYAPFTGDALVEIRDLPIIRLDHLITDFADTAALIAQMDLLITVDTVAAHIAGALGVKTFLLLPYCPDWRWGTSGETTHWYPSLILLRQPIYGDWVSVIHLLKNYL